MKTLKAMYKTEIKMSIREFSGMLFGVMLPVGLMLLLGVLYGDQMVEGETYTKTQQSVAAVLTIGICATGLMGIPITLSGYREKKLLKRFEVSPTTPIILIMVQFLSNLTFAVLSTALVIGIAILFFGYEMIGSVAWFVLGYLTLVFCMYSIGMLIASVAPSVKVSNLLCTLVYFPMFFLSGATVPYEIMPTPLQKAAEIMPLTHGIKMLKSITLGGAISDLIGSFILLLLIGAVCIIISVKTFRYDY